MGIKTTQLSIKELRSLCQSSAPNPARESKVGKFSRVFSIYFTKLFLNTSVTPNQITVFSVLIFFIGLSLFFFNSYYINIIGCLVVFFSIILDGCDGEVARFRQLKSRAGANYVEPVSHDIQYGFVFLVIALSLYWHGFNPIYLFLGGMASVTKLLYRLLEVRYWMLVKGEMTKDTIEKIKQDYSKKFWLIRLFYWLNKNFFSSTGVFLGLLFFTLINRVDWYIWFFTIGYGLLYIALFIKQVYKINHKML